MAVLWTQRHGSLPASSQPVAAERRPGRGHDWRRHGAVELKRTRRGEHKTFEYEASKDICEALHAAFGFGRGPDEDDGPSYPTAELPLRNGAR